MDNTTGDQPGEEKTSADQSADELAKPRPGARLSLLLIGLSFIGLILCMCLLIFFLAV